MKKNAKVNFERLYERANSRSEVADLQNNIFHLYYLYRHSYDMRRLLKHSQLTTEQKITIITELPVFKKCTTFSELLYLLIETQTTQKLYVIHEGFNKYVNDHNNTIIVQVFSAINLSPALEQKLSAQLEKSLSKKVMIQSLINETLVGGIVVKLPGGKVYDLSLNKAFSDFKLRLLEE
jgi:F-type H+-transporting ATPase subunit delta